MEEPLIFDSAIHAQLIPQFVNIHIACITSEPYTIATFLPPVKTHTLQKWWEERVEEAVVGSRKIIIQLIRDPTTGNDELAGGVVEKLLVLPEYRRKGVARRLMERLEVAASETGRTLLLLDTETGSPAEIMYPRLGYIQIGIVPDYGISPRDGSLKAGTFFYKNLVSGPSYDAHLET